MFSEEIYIVITLLQNVSNSWVGSGGGDGDGGVGGCGGCGGSGDGVGGGVQVKGVHLQILLHVTLLEESLRLHNPDRGGQRPATK